MSKRLVSFACSFNVRRPDAPLRGAASSCLSFAWIVLLRLKDLCVLFVFLVSFVAKPFFVFIV
jgi:hypothetical protein